MKNGTAIKERLSMPAMTFWAETNIPNCGVRKAVMVMNADATMLYETGTLNISSSAKLTTRRIAACSSI